MSALILKIMSEQGSDKDLLLDELNDEIESGQYDLQEIDFAVEKVLALLSEKSDGSVYESAMNVLSTAYSSTSKKNKVNDFISENIAHMDSGCLIHALSVVAESEISNRTELLNFYKESDNKSIKNAAIKYLSMIKV